MPLGVGGGGDKHKAGSSSARHGAGRRSASKGHRAGRSSISVDPESAGPTVGGIGRRADSDDAQAVRARSSSQAVELKAEFEQMLQRFEHDKTAWHLRERELVDYTNKLKMIKGDKGAGASTAGSASETAAAAAGSKADAVAARAANDTKSD